MNAARELVHEVVAAGGQIDVDGDHLKLVVTTPLSGDLMSRLRDHKSDLMAHLLSGIERRPPLVPSPSDAPISAPTASEDWLEWFDGHAAILEYDGARSRPDAERAAYGEALEAWCSCHWKAPAPDTCAACGKPTPKFNCGDGTRVCMSSNFACLIEYGTRRKMAAVKGLRKVGIEPPAGWVLPNGNWT